MNFFEYFAMVGMTSVLAWLCIGLIILLVAVALHGFPKSEAIEHIMPMPVFLLFVIVVWPYCVYLLSTHKGAEQ